MALAATGSAGTSPTDDARAATCTVGGVHADTACTAAGGQGAALRDRHQGTSAESGKRGQNRAHSPASASAAGLRSDPQRGLGG